jgi:tRNA(Ile)-lysidine synthase
MAIAGLESIGVRTGTLGASGVGVLAVSGGADSVALARSLSGTWPSGLVIAHLNHRLRGTESDADAEFVRELCPDLPHFIESLDVAQMARDTGENLEATARRVRYGFLTRVARQVGAGWIATAHTRDDQAETILHRLIRGSGLRGLRGIAESHVRDGIRIVRPMLAVTKGEVVDYLTILGQPWREDASNTDPAFTRNRLRHELLPLLRSYNPRISETLAGLAGQAAELFDAHERAARDLLARCEKPPAGDWRILDVPILRQAPLPLVREALVVLFERESWPRGSMTFDHWATAAAVATGTMTASDLPDGLRIESSGTICRVGIVRGNLKKQSS